jgi:hypothetical protein
LKFFNQENKYALKTALAKKHALKFQNKLEKQA